MLRWLWIVCCAALWTSGAALASEAPAEPPTETAAPLPEPTPPQLADNANDWKRRFEASRTLYRVSTGIALASYAGMIGGAYLMVYSSTDLDYQTELYIGGFTMVLASATGVLAGTAGAVAGAFLGTDAASNYIGREINPSLGLAGMITAGGAIFGLFPLLPVGHVFSGMQMGRTSQEVRDAEAGLSRSWEPVRPRVSVVPTGNGLALTGTF